MASGADTTFYTARFLQPDLLEKARANVLRCPVYRSGALVAPTSGTISIYDDAGSAVVSAASVTITSSVATYSYTPASTLALGEGWRVEWTLVISASTYVFENEAALCRKALSPVVTDADLYRRVSSLDPSGAAPISSLTDYQDYLDEAWAVIQMRLIGAGNRPNLILSPASLREAHLCLTLALIFEDLSSRLNAAYEARAADYRNQYQDAWKNIKLVYDADDDGQAESKGRTSAIPTYWLCGRGSR